METFEKEYRGNVIVVTVNLVSAALGDTNEFKEFLNEIILITDCNVVVDLSYCSHLDSTFIGALVLSLKKLRQKKRELVLVEPRDHTKIFLKMNSLNKIFRIYKLVNDAVDDLLNMNLNKYNHPSFQENVSEVPPNTQAPEQNYNVIGEISENTNEVKGEEVRVSQEIVVCESIDEFKDSNFVSEEYKPDEIEYYSLESTGNEYDSLPDDIKNSENKIMKEFETDDRDYRHGTIAWDFGL